MDSSKNPSTNHSRVSSSQELLSPGSKSRYGRTRRPKISQDFYDIDSVIIDENPVKTSPSVKSPKSKSPKPVIAREILFEIKDEFTQLDDLGMKVAQNFKSNRGLDDTIKERKFFKSMSENNVEVPNVVDVSKVLKLISTKPAVISDVYDKKISPKSMLKTYSNKRKHLHDGDNFVVESFALPDEPIIPVNNPISLEIDKKIDVDVNIQSDVNLPTPWSFEDTVPIRLSEEFNGNCFKLFPYDNILSEKSEIKSAEFNGLDTSKFQDIRQNDTATTKNNRNSTIKNAVKYVENARKRIREALKNPEKIVEIKSVDSNQCDISDDVKKLKISQTRNNETAQGVKKRDKKKSEFSQPPENRRVLRSNGYINITTNERKDTTIKNEDQGIKDMRVSENKNLAVEDKNTDSDSDIISISQTTTDESVSIIDLTETSTISETLEKRCLRSNSSINISTEENAKVVNPIKLAVCSSEVRVILSPLAGMKKSPENLFPNPFKSKFGKKESLKQKMKLRSFAKSGPIQFSDSVLQLKKNIVKKTERGRVKKQNNKELHIQEETIIDVKNIKIEIVEYGIGDLTWAKIGNHPYWPCMIIEEPMSGDYRKILPSRYHPLYHVRFFGDNGRRSWVSSNRIMLYCGKDDLDNLANILKAEDKVKASFIKEAYSVKPPKLTKWQIGVDEAESLKCKSVDERLNFFVELLERKKEKKRKDFTIKPEILNNIDTSDSVPRYKKRQRLSEDDNLKKPKTSNLELSEEKVEIKTEFEEEQMKSPKKILQSIEDTSPKKLLSEKRILRTSQQKDHPEEKTKRNSIDNIPDEEPDDYLLPKLRNKRHVIPWEYSNSDTDSKLSDNSSVPASLEAQAALYRRNNIFRGISKEKICQICEKPGEVFKCKGPCNGVYHYNCAMFGETKDDDEIKEKKTEAPEITDSRSNVEIISVNSKKPLPNLSTSPNYKGMSLAEKIDFRMKEIMKKFDYQSVYSESTDSSSEEFLLDESFEKHEKSTKLKTNSSLSLTVTSKPTKKEVPVIKHVTADSINYICVTKEEPKDKVVTELIKDTLKHLRCTWCSTGEISSCLVCGKEDSKLGSKFRQKCSLHQCGKYYHPECLKVWPQTQWSLIQSTKDKKSDASYDTFVCPRHVCHTCISDDPRAANSRCPSDKVVKCLRCPATYHSSNYCVPAGTQILTSSQIVCPRHYSKQKSAKRRNFQQTINTNWCLICSKGGDLICCETCPTSVHVECLPGGQNADDTFFCEDCQSGRLPLYDEIVWVKLGTFRWWPAIILFPNEVPDNVKNIAHDKGEFVVKFFGTYDHYWVGRGRTFLFQEGDKGHSNSTRKKVDSAFVKAVEEATAAHQLKKQFKGSKMAEKNSGLKPPPYIRIKVNKPVGNVRQFDGNTSNTTSCDCDPNQPHPCGPDSDCLNRLLLTECNPDVCPAGERCNNQCFEKREYPPLVPHHTQSRGWGLKTLAPIRKGQFVIEYVGEMIDEQEYQRRIQKMHEQKEENYYFLTIDKDRMLDAGPKGNVARFMNHSCQPNCETQKWTVNGDTRVGLFAKCDIPAGTELTFNYNLECIGKEKKICKCGAANCSGFIGVKVKTEGVQKKTSKPKKKKVQPAPDTTATDNPCFVCGKSGEVACCNNKICTKYYHLQCAGLPSWPEGGKWVCQWHNCNICSKRTFRCCVFCVNSYCPSHSKGNIRYDKLLGFLCTEHDPIKVEEETIKPVGNDDTRDGLSLEQRLNESVMSTASNNSDFLEESSQDEEKKDLTKSTKKSRKKVEKVQIKNTANMYNQNEVKLSKFTAPVKYLRTRKNYAENTLNRTVPEKDLPIRKRTRLRCGNNTL